MSIEIKRSIKPVNYSYAINLLEERMEKVINNNAKELIWFLQHEKVYTAGTSFNRTDILDKNIKIIKTSRGGKITCHNPGQLVCYMVINLNRRKRDIRKFIISLENSIIETLRHFKITANSDRKNIGIWIDHNNETKKIAAIGIRVSRWIAFHGCSINLNNNLKLYAKINPCGLDSKNITTVEKEIGFVPKNFEKELIKIFKKDFSYY